MSLGPLMIGVAGTELNGEDRARLAHPGVGGVLLFARNIASPEQLAALTRSIHELRQPPLLVAVDQEGGRVQRCREGFTRLPPVRRLGEWFDRDPPAAEQGAWQLGRLMARELHAVGIDFSFAPVLDLDHGVSEVIGDRGFHTDPDAVARLARAWTRGAREAGMVSVGKHFPGHGGCAADSHVAYPRDPRTLADLELLDLVPFRRLMANGLEAVMASHVIYPSVAPEPAGYSRDWLEAVLRRRLGFQGAVISDDLGMAAADTVGPPAERVRAALGAGCDMVIIGNERAAMDAALAAPLPSSPAGAMRLARLRPRGGAGPVAGSPGERQEAVALARRLAGDGDPAV